MMTKSVPLYVPILNPTWRFSGVKLPYKWKAILYDLRSRNATYLWKITNKFEVMTLKENKQGMFMRSM